MLYIPYDQEYVHYLWDGSTWTNPTIAQPRWSVSQYKGVMVYDTWRNVNVFYGLDENLPFRAGTWEY